MGRPQQHQEFKGKPKISPHGELPRLPNDVPPEFTLLKIQGPDIEMASIGIDALPDDWRKQLEVTRDLGAAWLKKNNGVLLRAPSAIVSETMNYLFNPIHQQAKDFRIVEVIAYPLDERIKR